MLRYCNYDRCVTWYCYYELYLVVYITMDKCICNMIVFDGEQDQLDAWKGQLLISDTCHESAHLS